MQLRADEYPRDTAGTTTLEIRYADAAQDDDFYIFVPSIRRVRRAPPLQRCATMALMNSISMISIALTVRSPILIIDCWGEKQCWKLSPRKFALRRRQGDYLPLEEGWRLHDVYVLEITLRIPATAIRGKCFASKRFPFSRSGAQCGTRKGTIGKRRLLSIRQ